ncbi:hypothetical protein QJS04_geneDACA001851 [Acorus gramineus]|uniref:Secreted protein n=1 Tax=Acorus gramineus TaxID=55184 RepID=A0AAV9BJQ4_ACOGR|nr:hypothetical protein QJS04_geneDACA001851 [Acorus gramineus]
MMVMSLFVLILAPETSFNRRRLKRTKSNPNQFNIAIVSVCTPVNYGNADLIFFFKPVRMTYSQYLQVTSFVK